MNKFLSITWARFLCFLLGITSFFQRDEMSFDSTFRALGPIQKPPSTPYLTTASVPSQRDINDRGIIVNGESSSEESAHYSIEALPGIEDKDGGPRADQLISGGDIVFGVRSQPDPQISTYELAHLNILLKERWNSWERLLDKKVSDIIDNLRVSSNNEEYFAAVDIEEFGKTTFRQLIIASGYYPEDYLGGYPSSLPNQLNIHLITANPDEISQQNKKRFRTPKNSNLHRALVKMVQNANQRGDPDDEIEVLSSIRDEKAQRDDYKVLVRQIIEEHKDITSFLSADSIIAKFSYMGVMVSSQEDTDLQTIQSRGGVRNLNLSYRGPTETKNIWSDVQSPGMYLYLILKRVQENGVWGTFQYIPWWSSVKQTTSPYATATTIGPINDTIIRSRTVPTREYCYRDISGRDCMGHLIYIGQTRYHLNNPTPLRTKALAIGSATAPGDDEYYNPSVRGAYSEKVKLPTIDLYLGV